MAVLVTLDQVKAHLRITTTVEDVVVQDYADYAEARVIDWCSTDADSRAVAGAWVPETVPRVIVRAILDQVGEFYRFRGDDVDGPKRQDGEELSVTVRELLRAYHNQAIA